MYYNYYFYGHKNIGDIIYLNLARSLELIASSGRLFHNLIVIQTNEK